MEQKELPLKQALFITAFMFSIRALTYRPTPEFTGPGGLSLCWDDRKGKG